MFMLCFARYISIKRIYKVSNLTTGEQLLERKNFLNFLFQNAIKTTRFVPKTRFDAENVVIGLCIRSAQKDVSF